METATRPQRCTTGHRVVAAKRDDGRWHRREQGKNARAYSTSHPGLCERERFPGVRAARPLTQALTGLALALLLGCAGEVPRSIRSPTPAPLGVAEARAAPEQHLGTPVRWGGSILNVENGPETTDVELLARPLDTVGEPRPDAAPLGRFIARFRGFLDPAEYPRDRLLTVSGILAGAETRDVGDYPYRYPVVRAQGRYLWPEPEPVILGPGYPGPWYDPWYDPWWDPWYGPGDGPGFRHPWY